MDETICPACKSDNESDAAYCDQCGQPLKSREGAPDAAAESGGCPACGGEVEDLGDGSGRCRACGLELSAAPEAEHDETSGTLAAALTAAILAKVRLGIPIDQAVSESCLKVLRSAGVDAERTAPPPAAAAAPLGRACPVCGADCPAGVERCPDCQVWFSARHRSGPCPSCGETADGDKCACGAALTVPAIAATLEPTVKFLCSTCKQPFVSRPEQCPDCGGAMISADRLRASL